MVGRILQLDQSAPALYQSISLCGFTGTTSQQHLTSDQTILHIENTHKMGIPKFFRWLTRKYPMILHNVKKEEDLPPCDNLYLDLNGIVHNCIHGNSATRHERVSKLTDLEEVWAACMRAIDEIVHSVKPKKVLLLAVDGVAPRAKMNQQRARRFRSAKDSQKLHDQLLAAGKNIPDLFDSNAISPGTQFMADLCAQLHFFVKYKVNTDPLYKPLKVVLSDGTVPGEGEHKMMDYIRNLRLLKDYDPNTRHCFYGADADLIMLSLLTHEPHFYIIREEHVITKKKDGGVQRMELSVSNNFQLIHISLLREYFLLEYKPLEAKMQMKFDIERIIDDFIFFCFFIGNDFLPSLSALDLAEGSLDHLIVFYKTCLPTMGEYITDNGVIHWDRAEPFMWVLGEHEHETFKNRIDEMSSRFEGKKTVTFTQEQTYTANALSQAENSRAPEHMQNLYKMKLAQKKTKKFKTLSTADDKKRYKRFVYQRKFKEDEKRLTQAEKLGRVNLEAKFRKQFAEANPEEKEEFEIYDVIKNLPDGYFSDLRVEDIPDSAVSEIDIMIGDSNDGSNKDMSSPAPRELQRFASTGSSAIGEGLEEEGKILASGEQQIERDNYDFMKDFATTYSQDANAAKRLYYKTKVNFDIDTPEGDKEKKAMLRKYLEGTQWVLYYYYKGAQHWRWYYPYHYAPIISDLGKNIVQDFLRGQTVIKKFETDHNCPINDKPYTPFQQLLSILPHKSMKLLPPAYGEIARNELIEYFPDDFDCDLNGKTQAYEAIVLIPFCAENRVLEEEAKIRTSGRVQLTDAEDLRNTINFGCFSYSYAPNKKNPQALLSTLTHLRPLEADFSQATFEKEYEQVGKFSFESKILEGVKTPCHGFPSFKYLNVTEIEYDSIVVNKRTFERAMVKIPQVVQESQPQELEKYVNQIAKAKDKHIFIDFPQQIEAFPMFFEDKFTMYTLYGDSYSNVFEVRKEKQQRDEAQWLSEVNRVRYNLMQAGIFCPKEGTNVLVTCNRVNNVGYDGKENRYYQMYNEKVDVLPFSLFCQKRANDHYMNIQPRMQSSLNSFKPGQPFICLFPKLFGLVGEIAHIDYKKDVVKVNFDAETEHAKVHDPFVAQTHLQQAMAHKKHDKRKNFFQDFEIEKMIKCPKNTVSRMTSSFLISYKNPEDGEKKVVDIGLNIKNYSKKQHVPRYVRFVANHDELVINQLGTEEKQGYRKNHQRNMKPRWEYSAECVDFIREYHSKFPDAFDAMKKCMEKNRAVHPLKDVYYSEGKTDTPEAIQYLRSILQWLEKLPISSLPFVEMGFDTLDMDLIEGFANHREEVQNNYSNVKVITRPTEFVRQFHVFAENFPFWSSPLYERTVSDFRAGHRVMNMNSTRREFVPYGLRGTVIGKTSDKVIVMFDEQYLAGTDLNQHCESYRGGLIDPNFLLNLTQKFETILRKDGNMGQIQKFTEQKQGAAGDMKELQDLFAATSAANPRQQKQQKPANSNSNQGHEERKNNNRQVQQKKPQEKQVVKEVVQPQQEAAPVQKEEAKDKKPNKNANRRNREKKFTNAEDGTQEPVVKPQALVKAVSEPVPVLTFNTLTPALKTNKDFAELMNMMDAPKLKQEMNIPTEAPVKAESPAKLNAGASAFTPDKTEKE